MKKRLSTTPAHYTVWATDTLKLIYSIIQMIEIPCFKARHVMLLFSTDQCHIANYNNNCSWLPLGATSVYSSFLVLYTRNCTWNLTITWQWAESTLWPFLSLPQCFSPQLRILDPLALPQSVFQWYDTCPLFICQWPLTFALCLWTSRELLSIQVILLACWLHDVFWLYSIWLLLIIFIVWG